MLNTLNLQNNHVKATVSVYFSTNKAAKKTVKKTERKPI